MPDTLNVPGKQLTEFKPSPETTKKDELTMLAGMQKITEQFPHSFLVGKDQEGFPFIVSRGDENGLSINHVLIDRTGIFQVTANGLSESLHQKLGQPGAIESFRDSVNSAEKRVGNRYGIVGQICLVQDPKTTGMDNFIYYGVSSDPVAKVDDLRYTLAAHDHLLIEDIQLENATKVQTKLEELSTKFEHPLYKNRHQLIFGDYSSETKRTLLESKDGKFSEEVTLQDGTTFLRDVIPTENGYMVILNFMPNVGEPSQSYSVTAEVNPEALTIRTVMPGDLCEHIYEPKTSKVPLAVLGTKFIDAVNSKGPYSTTLDIVSAEVITEEDVKWGTAPARSTEFNGISEKSHNRVVIKESNGQVEISEG